MGVVELDRHLVRQALDVVVAQVPVQQVLQRGGNEEVFLAQAQLLPGLGDVGRIQHAGNAVGLDRLGHGAEMVAGVEAFQLQEFSARERHRRSVFTLARLQPMIGVS